MLGLKRRTRVEGWALDVSDGEEVGYKSTLQRIGDNNRLWILALIVLVVVSGLLMHQAKRTSTGRAKMINPHQAKAGGDYLDQAHKDFIAEFVREKGKNGAIIEARFSSNRKFVFVVPGETGADDIEYLSKMAAELHLARFKNWATVEAYQRSAATGSEVPRATTSWVPSHYGFVVTFMDTEK